jgi:hypothetical protein
MLLLLLLLSLLLLQQESTLGCELRDLTISRQRVRDARSAGLIIIGDEILKGKCQVNSSSTQCSVWL